MSFIMGLVMGLLVATCAIEGIFLFIRYKSTNTGINAIADGIRDGKEKTEEVEEEKIKQMQEQALEDFSNMMSYNEDIAYGKGAKI